MKYSTLPKPVLEKKETTITTKTKKKPITKTSELKNKETKSRDINFAYVYGKATSTIVLLWNQKIILSSPFSA